jgi:flagellin
MPQTINTNVASLNAQRNLNTSQASLATSLQRLSSGLRINSAKDDAAGLAISERFSTQIRGNEQAARNANDGISLSQTAEGDLEQIGNNLQRIRELAVQSSNASNSASDRLSINNEATQLIAEIDRVAGNSSFNGAKLLDGTFTAQSFQVGANNTSNDRITITSIASARSNALGVGSGSSYSTSLSALTATTSTALTAGGLVLNGYNVGASSSDGVSSAEADSSAIAKAAAINAVSGNTGVTATIDATSLAVTATAVGGDTAGASINGVLLGNAGVVALSANATVAASEMTAAINAVSNQTGVTATASGTGYTLTAADGRNITVAATTAGDSGLTAATTHASINLTSSSSGGITIGGAQFAAIGASAVGNTAATASAGAGVSSLDLTTATGAQAALATLDSAINTINSTRGALGAYQNRFESTVSSLQTTTENLSASRSRIRDADFAKETANLTRSQILQQAGTAILSQANQLGQGVLSLLR